MKKVLGLIIALLFSSSLFAAVPGLVELQNNTQIMASIQNLNWQIGDWTEMNMDMGMVKGTSRLEVRSKEGVNFWLEQNMDLGFMGKQKIEILIDSSNGEIKKLIVNGKEEDPPAPGNMEVVSTAEDTITVPAGTFKSLHIQIKDNDSGNISDNWINPKEVPVNGMIKSVSPSQFGKVTLELTAYGKN